MKKNRKAMTVECLTASIHNWAHNQVCDELYSDNVGESKLIERQLDCGGEKIGEVKYAKLGNNN